MDNNWNVQDRMRPKNIILFIIILLVTNPQFAEANAGIPMLALALPGMAVSLIPVILIETWYVRKSLRITYVPALKAMSVANLASTFIGIPLTWAAWVFVEMTLAFFSYHIGESLNITVPNSIRILFSVTFGAAWLGPSESDPNWIIPVALLVLLVPFFYVSWIFERNIAIKFLKETSTEAINKATFFANIYSYGLLGTFVLGWLIYSIVNKGGT